MLCRSELKEMNGPSPIPPQQLRLSCASYHTQVLGISPHSNHVTLSPVVAMSYSHHMPRLVPRWLSSFFLIPPRTSTVL